LFYYYYLQVITLSDIALADGKSILPEVKMGQPILGRSNSLECPLQERPREHAWDLWNYHSAFLETKGILQDSLGEWIASSHQQWEYLYHTHTGTLFQVQGDTIEQYQPITRHHTGQRSGYWYATDRSSIYQHTLPSETASGTIWHTSSVSAHI
jgi:hypothetical protein